MVEDKKTKALTVKIESALCEKVEDLAIRIEKHLDVMNAVRPDAMKQKLKDFGLKLWHIKSTIEEINTEISDIIGGDPRWY